jgi:hypothetical protein
MAGLERDQQRDEYIDNKRKAGRAGSREDKVRAGKLGSVNRSAQMLAVWASGQRKRAAPKREADRSGRLRAAWAKRTAELDNAVLALCQRDTGASPKEIWAAFGRQQNIIRKLLERGLIERRGDYHDGRYHSLTPQPT